MYKSLFNDSSTTNFILYFSGEIKSVCTTRTITVSHVSLAKVFSVHCVLLYILPMSERSQGFTCFKAKVTDLQYSTGPLMPCDVSAESSRSRLM